MRQFVYDMPYQPPHQVFAAYADRDFSLFFDSSDISSPHSRYSFIAFDPVETLIIRDGAGDNPFRILKEKLRDYAENIELLKDPPAPFTGGAAGLFGYELAHYLEKLPRVTDDLQTPDMIIGLYHQVLAFDLRRKAAWFFVTARDTAEADSLYQAYLAQAPVLPSASLPRLEWGNLKDPDSYRQDIARVIEYIRAGDIFQANLSQQFQAVLPEGFNPYVHYLHLRDINPAPYGAYMNFGDLILSCSSPEQFLKVRNGIVETRPIKGTSPIHSDPDSLRSSAKNRAENIMIVDLLRNDLSKVCAPDSIDVPRLCDVETYAGLHHLVSTVTGRLDAGKDCIDALEACFPGGSITGAPKIRAMEIITEMEGRRRGPYCGSLGYIGFDGTMDTNIVIRTLIYKDGKICFNAGGGIVAGSDPDSEYRETLLKSQKILESFNS
jgi:para-aminobenzoate synthetase component 1